MTYVEGKKKVSEKGKGFTLRCELCRCAQALSIYLRGLVLVLVDLDRRSPHHCVFCRRAFLLVDPP